MAGTTFYSDRAFITINSVKKLNLKSCKWTVDEAVSRVETMTEDRTTAGFKRGNRKCTGSMELDVPNDAAEIDLSFLYGKQEVSIVCQLGDKGESWSLIGVVQTNQDMSGSVGEAMKTINFEARVAVNERGPAVNGTIGY